MNRIIIMRRNRSVNFTEARAYRLLWLTIFYLPNFLKKEPQKLLNQRNEK